MTNRLKILKRILLVIVICTILASMVHLVQYRSDLYQFSLKQPLFSVKNQSLEKLLTDQEKAALIREIVRQSLLELKNSKEIKSKDPSKSTVDKDGKNKQKTTKAVAMLTKKYTEVKTISPYLLQGIFLHNNKDLNQDLVKRNSKLGAFQIQTTNAERQLMYKLLQEFDQIMRKNNVTYFMYGGTLLGSFRHHDLIPWDDDIDVMVPLTEHDKMLKIFKAVEPEYVLYRAGGHDKFFHKDSKKVPRFNWKWPYVDVSYYEVNGTYIKDWTKTYGYWYYFPKSIVFPLHERPLLNLTLMAPKDTFAFLTWTYNYGSKCLMYGYSHMVEAGGPSGTVDCKTLVDKFPFVEHLPHPNGVREVLKFKDMVIADKVYPEPPYAIAETFKLSLKAGHKMPVHITPSVFEN